MELHLLAQGAGQEQRKTAFLDTIWKQTPKGKPPPSHPLQQMDLEKKFPPASGLLTSHLALCHFLSTEQRTKPMAAAPETSISLRTPDGDGPAVAARHQALLSPSHFTRISPRPWSRPRYRPIHGPGISAETRT